MISNQRPGVYSRVEISGCGGASGRWGVALLLPGEQHNVYKLDSYQEARDVLGDSRLVLDCARLLFEGAGRVIVVTAPGVSEAFLAAGQADVRAIVSGFTGTEELAALRDQAQRLSEEGRECIAFAGLGEPDEAISAAEVVNSGRVVLCCPVLEIAGDADSDSGPQAIYAACALAAAVLGATSPVMSFNGLRFEGLRVAQALPEDDIQRLIRAGVCVFEQVGAGAELIRGVTTHTQPEGGEGSLRGLGTVLIIDDVLGGVRGALRGKLGGSGKVSLEGVRDLVAVELRGKQDSGIIASFAPPRVRPKPGDPSVALVEISFGVAHLLSQIHLTAHIRV
ncbi:MAG: hypothetical protein FWE19_08255 [Oscillospiraceae bacterium]|nr:hypothetical protein [Oscillospiraceae bacterium]